MKVLNKFLFLLAVPVLLCITSSTTVLAFEKEFHEMMARISHDMMSWKHPGLNVNALLKGCTQPDDERGRGPTAILRDPFGNKKHKTDTTLINDNYIDAVDRFNSNRRTNYRKGLYEGQRILAKSMHYVCDQSEPRFGDNFGYYFNGYSFRGVAQGLIFQLYPDYQFREFLQQRTREMEMHLYQTNFNPRNERQIELLIDSLRVNTNRIINIIIAHPGIPDKRAEIENLIIGGYLPRQLALQNILIDNFFYEINTNSHSGPPVSIPQPNQNTVVNTWPYGFGKQGSSSTNRSRPYDSPGDGPASIASPRPSYGSSN